MTYVPCSALWDMTYPTIHDCRIYGHSANLGSFFKNDPSDNYSHSPERGGDGASEALQRVRMYADEGRFFCNAERLATYFQSEVLSSSHTFIPTP